MIQIVNTADGKLTYLCREVLTFIKIMENFIVSARKYRPDTFATVIGQQSITKTLANAIKNGQLAHAYLFCGPRGVGKTTCARIFAKTINCHNISETGEACESCDSCKSFNSSRSFNIHELDAASNNSVDDIRNLIDQVRIPPQTAKYSIYIIDEVHMLSAQAFNAFLKTLEEPPAHAVFILATTEKHKIIPTILSRCQIYDFNRIKVDDIVAQLEIIAKKESIAAEKEGLNIIAQKADGSMRDALSIFDQIVSFSGSNVTYRDVIGTLNVIDYDYYFRITEALLKDDMVESLLIFNEVLEKGFEGQNFIGGLSSHFRDLMVCKDTDTLSLLEVGASIRENYMKQSESCPVEFLFSALEITNQCSLGFKTSLNQRLHAELALIKICNTGSEVKKKSDTLPVSGSKQKPEKKGGEHKSSPPVTDKPEKTIPEADKPDKNISLQAGGFSGKGSAPTVSIKNVMQKTCNQEDSENTGPDEKQSDNDDDVPDPREFAEEFSEEDLVLKWKKFAGIIKEKQPRLYNTLMANKPGLGKNNRVEFELNNPLQDDIIKKVKKELIEFLKEELNNYSITLNTIISGNEQGSRLYLPEDRYKHMAEKNPDLEKLKQQFNLDFD